MTYLSNGKNNKRTGAEFEKEFCAVLSEKGFWVHFCTPAQNGSQPCDIIAVKNEEAFLIDCKTCKDKRFNISRLEDNQIYAFRRWAKCGNKNRYIAIKHEDKIYWVDYDILEKIEGKSLELTDEFIFR